MKCTCGNEMLMQKFGDRVVHYCNDCYIYDIERVECEHKNTQMMLLDMVNGKPMLKMYCKDCMHTFGNAIKQTCVDLRGIHHTTNAKYIEFRSKIDADNQSGLMNLIAGKISMSEARLNSGRASENSRYQQYLKSDEWRRRRVDALQRDNNQCQICGSEAENVHHLTYAHVGDEYAFELVSLCKRCHYEHYHRNTENEY